MRNIFLFIRRYFNFLFFLLLQGISIYFITHYSAYHEAAFGKITNQLTGKINARYAAVASYFGLKNTNDQLAKANEQLLNNQKSDFEFTSLQPRIYYDSLYKDSMSAVRKYKFIQANVVSNSVAAENNFIILSRGSSSGFRKGMGVIDPSNGVVGIITDLSDDFSVVMSVLHRDSRISGKLLLSGETGTLTWDGKEANRIMLDNISKSAKIRKGDTVITSGFSTSFPKGMMVGRVEAVYSEKSSNKFKVNIHTQANFYNLDYVYVIDNLQQQEIERLLDKNNKKEKSE